MARQKLKLIIWCILFMLLFSVMGCGGKWYHTEKLEGGVERTYYKDKDGRKVPVYDVNADGSVIAYDEDDNMYKNYMAGKKLEKAAYAHAAELERTKVEREKAAEQARLERIKRIRTAQKRSALTPIYVMVHQPKIEVEKGVKHGDMADRIRGAVKEQLDADSVLRTTSYKPDVGIASKIYFKQGIGYDKKKKKAVGVPLMYYKFTIRSAYLPEDTYTFEEHGNLFLNQQIVERATQRMKRVIKMKIGPNIPADRKAFL